MEFTARSVFAVFALLLLPSVFTPVLKGKEQQAGSSGDRGPQTLKNLSLEDLSKIEVTTVSKEPAEAFKTPAAISVLTREDIARSGATNIPDLLRLVPGVEVAQVSSDKWAIGIRGFQGYLSKAVLVLIDGRSVYTPLFAGVYWEMQDTLIEDIDRIEVIRGPGATIWGANAVNGVINIITRNARETRGSLVSAGGGKRRAGLPRRALWRRRRQTRLPGLGQGLHACPAGSSRRPEFRRLAPGPGRISHGLDPWHPRQCNRFRRRLRHGGRIHYRHQHLLSPGARQRGGQRGFLRPECRCGMAPHVLIRIGHPDSRIFRSHGPHGPELPRDPRYRRFRFYPSRGARRPRHHLGRGHPHQSQPLPPERAHRQFLSR